MGTHHQGPAAERRILNLYIKWMRATSVLEARVASWMAAEQITTAQFAVLEALWHLGPLCQGELGDKMLRSGGSVTSVVDRLEKKGWVQRQRSEQDRRVVLVALTGAGKRRIRNLFPAHVADLRQAFQGLTPAEQEQMARLCKKLGLSLAT
ncbi:MAG: MarR family transcriptional regulator [Planctomycetota bacterium]|nr:MAG: MarR family transcriptional regulator [Planctomycetota bacterium]